MGYSFWLYYCKICEGWDVKPFSEIFAVLSEGWGWLVILMPNLTVLEMFDVLRLRPPLLESMPVICLLIPSLDASAPELVADIWTCPLSSIYCVILSLFYWGDRSYCCMSFLDVGGGVFEKREVVIEPVYLVKSSSFIAWPYKLRSLCADEVSICSLPL